MGVPKDPFRQLTSNSYNAGRNRTIARQFIFLPGRISDEKETGLPIGFMLCFKK